MVTKSKKTGDKEEKNGRVKVNSLKLNRATVENLTRGESEQIKGGMRPKNTWAMGCTNDGGTQGNCTALC